MVMMKIKMMKRRTEGHDYDYVFVALTVGNFICINLLNPYTIHGGRYYYPYFTVEETEAQRS